MRQHTEIIDSPSRKVEPTSELVQSTKQWGDWAPPLERAGEQPGAMRRVGKNVAGRELDGRPWVEFPAP